MTKPKVVKSFISRIDCEQSLFSFRFSEGNARARTTEKRETAFFVPLPSRAISHARGHLRVSRFARRTTENGETALSLFRACLLGQYIPPPLRKYRKIPKISPSKYRRPPIR